MAGQVEIIHFRMDGQPFQAYPGDTVAAALYRSGKRAWRNFKDGGSRGLLCGMGTCYDCLVTIDGVTDVRACQTIVQEGMAVQTGGGGER